MSPLRRIQYASTPRLVAGVFVPERELAELVARGEAYRAGVLCETADGRTFVLEEALRFLGRVDGETDPFGLVGAVESVSSLLRRGFVMNSERAALGKLVYDVELGSICHPLPGQPPRGGPTPDESGPQPRLGR